MDLVVEWMLSEEERALSPLVSRKDLRSKT